MSLLPQEIIDRIKGNANKFYPFGGAAATYNDSARVAYKAGARDEALNAAKNIIWYPISQSPKEDCGWFMGAVNPKNWKEITVEKINDWRKSFGFVKVWYNKMGSGNQWWECCPTRHPRCGEAIGDRITHWAYIVEVPLLKQEENESKGT